jgi:hypothetical protein
VGIEQHLVALAGVGHQHKGAACAELQVGNQQLSPDAANHQPFLAPVELEGFAQRELERHEGAARRIRPTRRQSRMKSVRTV